MSKTSLKGLSALVFAFLAVSATGDQAFAQAKVKIGRVTADTTQSPQFTLTGKKKTFKSTKNWLEIDAVFQVSVSQKPKDGYLYYFVGADNVRLRRPVVPGDQLILKAEIETEKRGIYRFNCSAMVDDELVTTMRIVCAERMIDDD